MATTLTAVAIENGTLNAAHIGDCRLYLLRAGKITQMSKDHTMVGERVRMGLMTEGARVIIRTARRCCAVSAEN